MNVLRMGETTHEDTFHALRPNGHGCYLLLLVESPSLFETEEGWQKVEAGTAVFYLPGQRHHYRADGEPYTDCWMYLESDAPLMFEGFPFGKPLPLRESGRFFSLFSMMLDEFFSSRRTRESVLGALATALCDMLAAEVDMQGELFSPLLALREAVFRSPASAWSVEEQAKKLGVSCGYFHVLYKRYFGATFLSDAIAARIQLAEELLLSTPESVERIAERCGYVSVEHFIRQFKRRTNTTPHRFRTEHKK